MINIIKRMEIPILELALVDAFCDMCFYEGDEFVQDLESYISDVLAGKNTDEQDLAFLEISESYIMKSLIMYGGQSLLEAQEELTVGVDDTKKSNVPADSLKQMKKTSRDIANKELTRVGNKKLTEVEEEIFGQIVMESLQKAVEISKEKIDKVGKKLANAATSGITVAQKKLQNFLTNVKINDTEGKVAIASPEEKSTTR